MLGFHVFLSGGPRSKIKTSFHLNHQKDTFWTSELFFIIGFLHIFSSLWGDYTTILRIHHQQGRDSFPEVMASNVTPKTSKLHSCKLTQLAGKWTRLKMYVLLKMGIFHCYVTLPEGTANLLGVFLCLFWVCVCVCVCVSIFAFWWGAYLMPKSGCRPGKMEKETHRLE